jgi:hypothetical protein
LQFFLFLRKRYCAFSYLLFWRGRDSREILILVPLRAKDWRRITSVPAVLRRKGLESWLQPWLFIALLFWREENWRRISICTCCSKGEGIGELAPALAANTPAVLAQN